MTQAAQALAALSVHGARALSDLTRPDSESLANARRLISRVTPETMRAFIDTPEVRNGAKGATAVGASIAVSHGIENTLAGTESLRALGRTILTSYPSIARILARNPNAALVAGTVAFPYVASPFFEQWFKTLMGHEGGAAGRDAQEHWKASFMATVANWNHVQPALATVLRNHPAVHALAGPLATGLMSGGATALNAAEDHRLGAAGASTGGASTPTPGELATGKAIASQTRYFVDALRQAFKKNAHVPNLASELLTSNLYPGWVAALSNLGSRDVADRVHSKHVARAREADNGSEADIGAMLDAADGRELLAHFEARPTMFAGSQRPGVTDPSGS